MRSAAFEDGKVSGTTDVESLGVQHDCGVVRSAMLAAAAILLLGACSSGDTSSGGSSGDESSIPPSQQRCPNGNFPPVCSNN